MIKLQSFDSRGFPWCDARTFMPVGDLSVFDPMYIGFICEFFVYYIYIFMVGFINFATIVEEVGVQK